MMDSTERGINLIKSFESCKLKAYVCPAGKLTIGWGHTGRVYEGMTITAEEAERLLLKDVSWSEDVVEKYVGVPLSPHQFDALTSWVFNHGEDKVKDSTLFRVLNKGNYEAVPAQLLRWTKHKNPKTGRKEDSRGLKRRRVAEVALWNDTSLPAPPTEAEKAADPMPQAICPSTPPMGALAKSRTIWGTGIIGVASAGEWLLGTATAVSTKTSESLSGTSALLDHVGAGKSGMILVIVLCAAAVVICARVQDWTGGRG